MDLEETVTMQAAWAMLSDEDLLARVASLAYCYAIYRDAPPELFQAFDVAYNRGLLDTSL